MTQPMIDRDTIQKFDKPGPRYTSYPTAPEWSTEVGADIYRQKLGSFGRSDKTLSLYIHLPFCRSMCYFCACNVLIRKAEDRVGDEYIDYLEKEVEMVCQALGRRKAVKQLHWGGGTPTFLNEAQIERLFRKLQNKFDIDFGGEIAIEIDPRTIDRAKVKKLREIGFNRVSMGVQDFNRDVQRDVNRVQPFSMVRDLFSWCRELGFHSINVDLIYGLPGQTKKSFQPTVEKVTELRPDRVALYSFAYVPWLKKHQTKLDEQKLPSPDEKLEIFLQSRRQFLKSGYRAIAMDHFALKDDELAKAFDNGTLSRNFMGYTVKPADEYIGMGLTAIGFLENTFIQNYKILKDYYRLLDADTLPVEQGKVLTEDDQIRQWTINSLMCRFQVDKEEFAARFCRSFEDYFDVEQEHIDHCCQDGLLERNGGVIHATDLGKLFIRNVCMGFDKYLRESRRERKFSRTV